MTTPIQLALLTWLYQINACVQRHHPIGSPTGQSSVFKFQLSLPVISSISCQPDHFSAFYSVVDTLYPSSVPRYVIRAYSCSPTTSIQIVLLSHFLLDLRRTQVRSKAPSRPSGLRSSVLFRIPTASELVEDMEGLLDYGPNIPDVNFAERGHDDAPVTGLSLIQRSSEAGVAQGDQLEEASGSDHVSCSTLCQGSRDLKRCHLVSPPPCEVARGGSPTSSVPSWTRVDACTTVDAYLIESVRDASDL